MIWFVMLGHRYLRRRTRRCARLLVADKWGQHEWGRCESNEFWQIGEKGTPWHFWEDEKQVNGSTQKVPLSKKTKSWDSVWFRGILWVVVGFCGFSWVFNRTKNRCKVACFMSRFAYISITPCAARLEGDAWKGEKSEHGCPLVHQEQDLCITRAFAWCKMTPSTAWHQVSWITHVQTTYFSIKPTVCFYIRVSHSPNSTEYMYIHIYIYIYIYIHTYTHTYIYILQMYQSIAHMCWLSPGAFIAIFAAGKRVSSEVGSGSK